MITMTNFQQIIQLRNAGKTQEQIAQQLGISRRSVMRYLKQGKVPVYNRSTQSNRPDPMGDYLSIAKEKLLEEPKILLVDLYDYLVEKGYQGSERTLRRKTLAFRKKLRSAETYFEREVHPGEVMEGDFTEFYVLIAGVKQKVFLWVSSLPFSNAYFASPYLNCNFECFADGTVNAINEFGGVAKKYRLDNMSPVVSKILSGKQRQVTVRFKQLQDHYGFEQDFCNPAKGNEKGNVESNNRHIKRKILSKIVLDNIEFSSLEAFRSFVWTICRDHNKKAGVQNKLAQEPLSPLPKKPFQCYRTQVVSINKYSLFNFDKSGVMYSVPSKYMGLSLELRSYPGHLELLHEGQLVAKHLKIQCKTHTASIKIEHIIDALAKKPGAMKDWKHRHVLFERPAWKRFYSKLKDQGLCDKDYINCLKLLAHHGRDLVTIAMELAIEGRQELTSKTLEKIITNQMDNIHEIKPLQPKLDQFDTLLHGENNGKQPQSKP